MKPSVRAVRVLAEIRTVHLQNTSHNVNAYAILLGSSSFLVAFGCYTRIILIRLPSFSFTVTSYFPFILFIPCSYFYSFFFW
jgi:hypothetical protein